MITKIIEIIALPLIAFVIGIFFMGLARKIMANIHWRYGPPIYQPIIDMIKLFNQNSVSHGFIFDFGVIFSLVGAIVLILFIPFGKISPLSNSGGLLVILYIMLIVPLGLALSGGEAANPNVSIGISRKFILALGYEVPFILILLVVMKSYNSISLLHIVNTQQAGNWAIFSSVPLFLSGVAYLLILPAILGVRPFDMVTAQQEIASGPKVEYGGKYLAFLSIEHALTLYIGLALFIDLFLGGASNLIIFFIKILVVFVMGIFINAVFPRLRIEQAVKYLWGFPTLIALAGLILAMII